MAACGPFHRRNRKVQAETANVTSGGKSGQEVAGTRAQIDNHRLVAEREGRRAVHESKRWSGPDAGREEIRARVDGRL